MLGGRSNGFSGFSDNVLAFAVSEDGPLQVVSATFNNLDKEVRSVAFSPENGGLWVACGGRLTDRSVPDTTQALKWSVDGIAWLEAQTNHSNFLCRSVTRGAVLESVDGKNWTHVPGTDAFGCFGVAYSTFADRFVVVGANLLVAVRLSVIPNSKWLRVDTGITAPTILITLPFPQSRAEWWLLRDRTRNLQSQTMEYRDGPLWFHLRTDLGQRKVLRRLQRRNGHFCPRGQCRAIAQFFGEFDQTRNC